MKQHFKKILLSSVVLVMVVSLFSGVSFADPGSGMVAHYTFDGNLKDTSGNGNDGTAVGNITYTKGPLGQAAVFDGSSYISVNDSDSLDLGKQFTLSVWVFNNENEKYQGILQKQESEYSDSVPSYCIFFEGMWPWFSMYDVSGKIDFGGDQSQKRIDCRQWDLFTVTYDGSILKYYKNGDPISSAELSGGAGLGKSDGKLMIGMAALAQNAGDNDFNGRMDDLRIYNKLLSQTDIRSLYASAASGADKNLVSAVKSMVAYYNFNKDTKDYSGNSNDGQISGSTVKFVDSVASKGAYFGGHSYITIKNSDSLQVDKGFTASAWIKLDDVKPAQYEQPILSSLKASNNTNMDAYDFLINSSYLPLYHAQFNFTSFVPNSGNDSWNTSEAYDMMGPSAWSMVTVTYDGSTAKYYKDGILKSSVEADGNKGDINHFMGNLQIGHISDNGKEYFTKGIIDELRIYNYVLSNTDVKTLATYRDSLLVTSLTGDGFGSMKLKQSVQLGTKLSTYAYTPSATASVAGKNTFKVTPVTGKVAFKSSSTKVATVSSTGKITAVGKGKATITASYGQLSTNVSIVVK